MKLKLIMMAFTLMAPAIYADEVSGSAPGADVVLPTHARGPHGHPAAEQVMPEHTPTSIPRLDMAGKPAEQGPPPPQDGRKHDGPPPPQDGRKHDGPPPPRDGRKDDGAPPPRGDHMRHGGQKPAAAPAPAPAPAK